MNRNSHTVRMNEMPRFYVGKLLLHHYKSNLDHISDFDSTNLKDERKKLKNK